MGLDLIDEKNADEVITYALDYPSMILSDLRSLPATNMEEFAFGLYIGYIRGIFFDGFLKRNKRFLNTEESTDFHAIILKRIPEIKLKIQTHLVKK